MIAAVSTSPDRPHAIAAGELMPWAIFAGLLAALALYFVGIEGSAASLFNGAYVHEFLHDGRHLLGLPCH